MEVEPLIVKSAFLPRGHVLCNVEDYEIVERIVDSYLSKQNQPVAKSTTSEEVQRAIELLREPSKSMDYFWLDAQMHDALNLAITALQAYQPTISKTEAVGVSSDGFSYDAKPKQFQCLGCLDYFYMPQVPAYCPNCGRRLED